MFVIDVPLGERDECDASGLKTKTLAKHRYSKNRLECWNVAKLDKFQSRGGSIPH